jgi:hypothetical protein
MSETKKYRVDVRRTKRGKIVHSYWTDTVDTIYTRSYVDIYQYVGKRLFRVKTITPTSIVHWKNVE